MKNKDNIEEFFGCEKDLSFKDYEKFAKTTAKYPNIGSNYYYPALGLGGETGEILEKLKKLDRDHGGVLTNEYRVAILKEIGDQMWYQAALCAELGSSMEEAARLNIEKLSDRKKRGVIKGDGDDR